MLENLPAHNGAVTMNKCNKCHTELEEPSFPFNPTGGKTRRIGFCENGNAKTKAMKHLQR